MCGKKDGKLHLIKLQKLSPKPNKKMLVTCLNQGMPNLFRTQRLCSGKMATVSEDGNEHQQP